MGGWAGWGWGTICIFLNGRKANVEIDGEHFRFCLVDIQNHPILKLKSSLTTQISHVIEHKKL